ncbi:hypothetical protein [Candidatus Clostridium radicumherbarum]|uniref:Uncharacterized protein n=1 Tax=Candidatus Clostridium radicumherbarum TaxID=3381662 RepID=A0ABW8TYD3_9CLOT
MKNKKAISILVILIVVLALAASFYGVFSTGGSGSYKIKSFYGETVSIYGKGLYRNDSVSVAAQGIAQDIVTIIVGVPLLVVSLYLSRKDLLKGRLLLAGTLGYFLYTYTSYCFVWMYNSLFLIYVILMSSSFFAFLLTMMSFDMESLKISFNEKLPVRLLGSFFIFLGTAIGLMWLGRIVPSLINGSEPVGIEQYTTLPIQALDLGFIVPTAIISGVLTIKRETFGYLLSSVITVKCITMLTAITAMIIGQSLAGVKLSFAEIIIFPAANLIVIYLLTLIIKNVKEPIYNMA